MLLRHAEQVRAPREAPEARPDAPRGLHSSQGLKVPTAAQAVGVAKRRGQRFLLLAGRRESLEARDGESELLTRRRGSVPRLLEAGVEIEMILRIVGAPEHSQPVNDRHVVSLPQRFAGEPTRCARRLTRA